MQKSHWVPAFAGMTATSQSFPHSAKRWRTWLPDSASGKRENHGDRSLRMHHPARHGMHFVAEAELRLRDCRIVACKFVRGCLALHFHHGHAEHTRRIGNRTERKDLQPAFDPAFPVHRVLTHHRGFVGSHVLREAGTRRHELVEEVGHEVDLADHTKPNSKVTGFRLSPE